jgi:hypothetical protein
MVPGARVPKFRSRRYGGTDRLLAVAAGGRISRAAKDITVDHPNAHSPDRSVYIELTALVAHCDLAVLLPLDEPTSFSRAEAGRNPNHLSAGLYFWCAKAARLNLRLPMAQFEKTANKICILWYSTEEIELYDPKENRFPDNPFALVLLTVRLHQLLEQKHS